MGALLMSAGPRPRSRLVGEQGVGMVTALMVALVVFALGAVWTTVGLHQVESSAHERRREQALHAAEAGINVAISRLATDPGYLGTSARDGLGDATGEYEVEVREVDPTNPSDLRRYIVARGYSGRAQRQIEQQVRLVPAVSGFDWALFASPGAVVGANNLTVTGDAYGGSSISLANFSNVFGDVVSLGSVSTSNNSTVGGDIHAGGSVAVHNANTTVQGDVLAGGAVALTGHVLGDVQAGGPVDTFNTGTVDGTVTPFSAPDPPPDIPLPTFTWDPADYTGEQTWESAAAFEAHWAANRTAFAGAHRITDTAPVTLDLQWTMSGDVTLVSDGPIHLSRDVANATAGDLTLVVVSLATGSAIRFTNNVTLPPSIKALLYAESGTIDFEQLKDFHGVVYARDIELSQQFTLTWARVEAPGFTFPAAASTRYGVEVQVFREVPFGT